MERTDTSRMAGADRHASCGQRGFSLIELMIALSVLLIGISGILSMHLVSMRATAYSRHATEAAVLAEDKMEDLRTIPADQIPTTLTGYPDPVTVDAQGNLDPNGLYTVNWMIAWDDTTGTGLLTVSVSWNERGTDLHTIEMTTQRSPPQESP